MSATEQEIRDRFLAETCERKPAEPGDIRFEHGMFEDGMEETPFWVEAIDDCGNIVERNYLATEHEVWNLIESFRECQGTTLEERLAPFGIEWQRERASEGMPV